MRYAEENPREDGCYQRWWEKRVGDDLTVAEAAAEHTGLVFHLHNRGVAALGGQLQIRSGDFIVAIGTTDFFGNICHQIQVGTPGGNVDGIALYGDFQQGQILDHVFLGNVGAE